MSERLKAKRRALYSYHCRTCKKAPAFIRLRSRSSRKNMSALSGQCSTRKPTVIILKSNINH